LTAQRNSIVTKMQIMKMRGQPTRPGLHTFRSSSNGLEVFSPDLTIAPGAADKAFGADGPRLGMGGQSSTLCWAAACRAATRC